MKLLTPGGIPLPEVDKGVFRIGLEMYRLGSLYITDKSLVQTAQPLVARAGGSDRRDSQPGRPSRCG